MKGFGGSFLGTGGRSILGRDRSVKISSTKLFWAFFFFQLLWFCTFFDDFWGFGEFMIEIMWDLNREQQLYDQRTQLLLICHWKILSQFWRFRGPWLSLERRAVLGIGLKTYVSLTGKCKLVSPIGFLFGTAIFKSEKLPIFQSS